MLISLLNINSLTWQRYIIFSVLVGVLYALTFGFVYEWNTAYTILDAVVSSLAISICAVALWNIFTYGMSDMINSFQRISILVMYASISIVLVLSIELLLGSFLAYPLDLEIKMIPAKILVLSLLFYTFRISFLRQKEIKEKNEAKYGTAEEEFNDEKAIDNCNGIDSDKEELSQNNETKIIDHISFKTGNKIKMVQVTDLVFLKAEDDYVSFVTADGHWLKKGTMKEFGASLPSNKFVRVHRSYIVNIDKISKIECYGQKHQLLLNTGANLWISISGYRALRDTLGL